MRKNLYIIGARGFGRDFVGFCRTTPGLLDQYNLVGFLDDKVDALDGYADYPPIVGPVEDFKVSEGDVFFCAMGNVKYLVKYTEMLLARGAKFDTFISKSAVVHPTAQIGEGCFIWNNTTIASDSCVGNHVVIQSNVVVGHDVSIGNYSILDTGVTCCGFVNIGERVAIHTGVKVAPKIHVGSGAQLGIGSIVVRDVHDGQTVFGNPARPILAPAVN